MTCIMKLKNTTYDGLVNKITKKIVEFSYMGQA